MLDERLPGHGCRSPSCTRGILVDGTTAGGEKRLLLQIFSQTLLGPVFFEFIERAPTRASARATSRLFCSTA
jgi:4-hydroxyphenylpyruvate dioxygenase